MPDEKEVKVSADAGGAKNVGTGLPKELLDEAAADDKALSDEVDKLQPADPAQARQAEENRKLALQLSEGTALEGINTAARWLNQRFPHLSVSGEERQGLAAAAAPVMLKHAGGEMPAWLLPYAEEFRLGMALAGVGFGLYLQAAAHAEAEEKARQQAEHDRQHGITRNAQAARADGHPGAPGGGSAAPIAPAPAVNLTTGPMAGLPGGVTL